MLLSFVQLQITIFFATASRAVCGTDFLKKPAKLILSSFHLIFHLPPYWQNCKRLQRDICSSRRIFSYMIRIIYYS